MEIFADMLLASGALGAGFYCLVLGRRLRRFTDLEQGVGGAVAVLSAQVDDLSRMLGQAESRAGEAARELVAASDRGEAAARSLELLLASLHDLPTAPPAPRMPQVFVRNPHLQGQEA